MTAVQNLLSILLALCVPAMIALWMPPRWRVAVLVLWILAPLAVLLAMAGIEAWGNPAPDDPGKLLHGLAILGSVLALPWLVACLAGFVAGSVLRSRRRTAAPASAPLGPLAEAAAQQDSVSGGGERRVAPDGSIMVELVAIEWFNSQWVHCPCVTALRTGRTLLDLRGTDWDAVVTFPRGQAVRLDLSSYRHGGARRLEIDLATGRYTVEGCGESGAIAALPALFEAEGLMAYGDAGRFLPPARPRATARNYGVALLIFIGALLAIAGATFATLRLSPGPSPHKLDRVPTMPRP
jgi:hypothetical protein